MSGTINKLKALSLTQRSVVCEDGNRVCAGNPGEALESRTFLCLELAAEKIEQFFQW